MKSNTVIFTEPYKAEIQEIDCPKPGKSEVLIRTEQTLISTGTELTFLTGECPEKSKWSEYIHYPQKSGYSNVGIIEEVGEGVSKDLIGKRVASFSGHSQYVIVNVNELRMINYEIKPEEATFFALAETTINGIRRTGIELGNRVVVYGAGIVGQLAARFLLAGGCTEIFVVNRSEARLKHLPDQRAIIPICSTKEDPISIIKEYTYGDMADIVIETTGNADAIPEEFLALHQQGKLCMLSSPKKKTLKSIHEGYIEKTITMLNGEGNFDQEFVQKTAEELQKMVDEGVFASDSVALTDDEATEEFRQGRAAMWYSGNWKVDLLCEEGSPLEGKLTMVNWPAVSGADGDQNSFVGGASATLVASATSAHKKEAVEFMTFMSEHFSNYAYEEGAILPTWKYSGDMELKPFQQTLLDLMQGADGFCLAWDTLLDPETADVHSTSLQGIYAQQMTADDYVEAMAATR